ncbi:MAG: SRPBCC domain-containing protein [Candidatus Krumholzibacteriia bacterium]
MTGMPPIVVELSVAASRHAVWKAITDPDDMRRWYFEQMEDFQPRVGFETRFTVRHGGRDYRHVWRVTEVVPQIKITYTWKYEGLPGEGATTWELSDSDGGTTLTLTNTGLESFPRNDPAFTRESCEGGWRYFIKERLAHHLGPQP